MWVSVFLVDTEEESVGIAISFQYRRRECGCWYFLLMLKKRVWVLLFLFNTEEGSVSVGISFQY